MKRLYAAMRRAPEHEQCELCGLPISDDHQHVFSVTDRSLRCACQACALILPTGAAFRSIPRERVRIDVACAPCGLHAATDLVRASAVGAWLDVLGVPVGVAATIVRDGGHVDLVYPGPAGLATAAIDTAVWHALCGAVPEAATLAPEVEALVWTRLGEPEVWRVGIDVVFRLVGELRASWEGITGGGAAPAAIARVLDELRGAA